MTSENNGLLMVMMEPPAVMEEEFHAWYDTEHLPERVVLPGFQSGMRFVCLDGYPRYMALYDLDSEAVLESRDYLAISGDNFSPWTKRVTSRMPVYRVAATQCLPGREPTRPTSRLIVLKRKGGDASAEALFNGLKTAFDGVSEVAQLRLFECREDGERCHFALIGLSAPLSAPIAYGRGGPHWSQLALANIYAPYDPRR